jgi:hypothetical protein
MNRCENESYYVQVPGTEWQLIIINRSYDTVT